jgi:sterol desaturase/sphingolipid hydroxylase (fatty acid hydroxylase superfamily)
LPTDALILHLQLAIFGTYRELSDLAMSPYSRTWWPVLLVSLAAAIWLAWRGANRTQRLPSHLRLASFETWLGRSALNDYWLLLLNGALLGVTAALWIPDASRISAGVAATLRDAFPDFAAQPRLWAPVLLALTLFVVDDFMRYLLHWLEHRVPFLWELHKVHHSAEVMNFVTAERHHPISLVFFRLGILIPMAAINGVFIWLFGDSLTATSVFGANLFWVCATMLASALRHSPVWLSFGPSVEKWLLSPAQHQVHHSTDERHFGKNLGGSLAIWDRVFGTLFVTGRERIVLEFGLGEENRLLRSPAALYWRPLVNALRVLVPSRTNPVRALQG